MAFRSLNVAAHLTEFNSAVSSDFLELYRNALDAKIRSESEAPKHKTFAPSAMRCDRISWFRLRGSEPDKVKIPDRTLQFTADIGTACHEMVQSLISKELGDDWISVNDWYEMNYEFFHQNGYKLVITSKGFESMVDLKEPFPVRFACDGIINFEGKYRLLEIKTSEFSSWNDLMEPKPKHLDQIKTYSMLLNIPDVLFLYVDRMYGGVKCFEVTIDPFEHQAIKDRMIRVMELVEANIAPEGLPVGDPDCSPSMCPYHEKCKSWGRL